MATESAATLTATIISTVIASLVALIVNYISGRSQKRRDLDNELHLIIKYSFDYPYLESKSFIAGWDDMKNKEDERYMRYDIYCNLIFNYLEKLSKFHEFDMSKISSDLNIKDWIRTHRSAWENPLEKYENVDSYNDPFKQFVDKLLK